MNGMINRKSNRILRTVVPLPKIEVISPWLMVSTKQQPGRL